MTRIYGRLYRIRKMNCEKYLRLADLDNFSKILLDKKALVNFTYGKFYDLSSLKVLGQWK